MDQETRQAQEVFSVPLENKGSGIGLPAVIHLASGGLSQLSA
jgi:hypothetical protein